MSRKKEQRKGARAGEGTPGPWRIRGNWANYSTAASLFGGWLPVAPTIQAWDLLRRHGLRARRALGKFVGVQFPDGLPDLAKQPLTGLDHEKVFSSSQISPFQR